jgi:bacterioferritin
MTGDVDVDRAIHTLIKGLNEDLANEYAAIIMYNYNAARLSGLSRQVVKPFFEKEIPNVLAHAACLAEKISMLGGTPVVKSAPIKRTENVKEMLKEALRVKENTIERYKKRLKQAEEAGEIVLKIQLEDIVTDEIRRKKELEYLLEDRHLH